MRVPSGSLFNPIKVAAGDASDFLGVVSAPRSLSGPPVSMSSFESRAAAALASAAFNALLIASASAADASTNDSTPFLSLLDKS